MKQRSRVVISILTSGVMFCFLLSSGPCAWAQSGQAPQDQAVASAVRDLQEQVQQLRAAVAEVRSEAAEYRAETDKLRHELEAMRAANATPGYSRAMPESPAEAAAAPGSYPGLANSASEESGSSGSESSASSLQTPDRQNPDQRIASLEDSVRLLDQKITGQYQTKVESASKYRVRLNGIVLMNLFSNQGVTDNLDVPSFATASATGSDHSFGATLRQSELGLEVFGPSVAGAKTSANFQADFGGGFANTWDGVNYGQFRLRTASMRLDWQNTSIVVGQDRLFLSPLSPTSYASLLVPAFNYSGNLWGWIPQIRVERRLALTGDQDLTLQAGIFDNLTGEFPSGQYDRTAQAGERSGQPAYGTRAAWTRNIFGEPITLGAGGYYSRQNWQFGRSVDGWAGMADWSVPLPMRLRLSGEFYRGSAIGSLGASFGRSVVFNGNPSIASTNAYGLDSAGGWSQLKLQATPKIEFNGVFGLDNPYASEANSFAASQPYTGQILVRNLGELANFIYRPRSNLLVSAEYRHMKTAGLGSPAWSAGQLNMVMGILF